MKTRSRSYSSRNPRKTKRRKTKRREDFKHLALKENMIQQPTRHSFPYCTDKDHIQKNNTVYFTKDLFLSSWAVDVNTTALTSA